MRTTTIRVSAETRNRLNAIARRRGAPAGEVVAELVELADDAALLEAAAESWDRLTDDPELLAAYRGETAELSAFDTEPPAY